MPSMFADGAVPVFGLQDTPVSPSHSLGSGSALPTYKGLPDADWGIFYTLCTFPLFSLTNHKPFHSHTMNIQFKDYTPCTSQIMHLPFAELMLFPRLFFTTVFILPPNELCTVPANHHTHPTSCNYRNCFLSNTQQCYNPLIQENRFYRYLQCLHIQKNHSTVTPINGRC